MAKKIYFDPANGRLLGRLDTDAFDYPSLPTSCIDVSAAQFDRCATGTWAVVNTANGSMLEVNEAFFQPPSPDHVMTDGAWVLSPALRAQNFAKAKDLELAAFRLDREKFLNRLTGIGMAALQTSDPVMAAAVATFRQGLLDLPSHASVTAATDLPALKAAMKARYAAIVAAAPAATRIAFAKVDQ